jgi:hypothetical protein
MYGGDVAAILVIPLFILTIMFWFSSKEGR